MIRRMVSMMIALSLLMACASAESFQWLDYSEMKEQFDFLGLSLYKSQKEGCFEMDIYADDDFTIAAIILLNGGEVFSASFADDNGNNDNFLKLMATNVIKPEDVKIRSFFEVWLELQLSNLQANETRTGNFGNYQFTVEKRGKVRYVTVAATAYTGIVTTSTNQTATSEPMHAPTQKPTSTPVTTDVPPTYTTEPPAAIMLKPGIAGSNAYDLTLGAEDNGLTVGKRQSTSDGYSWLVNGSSHYGSYTVSIETNKQYEIHRAVFSHAGTDATFFPWAVTLPFDASDVEGATAWVKACQKDSRTDTFTTGDAVWTYKPHENGKHGGVLTLTVDTFEAYSRYLLDQLE